MADDVRHIVRDRRLTPEEIERYRELRGKLDAELPDIQAPTYRPTLFRITAIVPISAANNAMVEGSGTAARFAVSVSGT